MKMETRKRIHAWRRLVMETTGDVQKVETDDVLHPIQNAAYENMKHKEQRRVMRRWRGRVLRGRNPYATKDSAYLRE